MTDEGVGATALIGTSQVPVDEVATVLLAISEIPTERRMDVVAVALRAWLEVEYQGGTRPRDLAEWKRERIR